MIYFLDSLHERDIYNRVFMNRDVYIENKEIGRILGAMKITGIIRTRP